NEGYTAGSMSIEQTATILRVVCAEIRAQLVACRPDPSATYWDVLDVIDLDRHVTGAVATKSAGERNLIGASVRRLDLPAKLAGAPSFVHDLQLDGMLHGRVVRAPRLGARLVTCDDDAV